MLTDCVFPQLNTEAKQLLALQQFMSQIDNPRVAFTVKQSLATTVEQAVTIKLESFLGIGQRFAQLEEAPAPQVSV